MTSRAMGASAALCAAVALAGCSVTVNPKAAAAPVTSSATVAAPSTTVTTAPAPATTPTSVKPTGKDVDHTVCQAAKAALVALQPKADADKDNRKKLGADMKSAASALRTQSQKTKNADLKSTLSKMAGYYDALSTAILDAKTTDTEQKNITTAGQHLETLCPQQSG